MWQDLNVETSADRQEVAEFLKSRGLHYDFCSEHTVEIRQKGAIVATGSLKGSVLQCFAVDKAWQGEGLANRVVDHLLQLAFERGKTRVFVFTTPFNAFLFREMGFRILAETKWAVLLESGSPSISDYTRDLEKLRSNVSSNINGETNVGLVMNCNPFTLGHQYLVEKAAASSEHVFLLVVEEDRSVFPFRVRFDLVKKGTAHLGNVTVVPSGPYAVSLATFPSYFSAEETTHARAGASIDATMYGRYIAKALGITTRLVGTEPYSPVTAIYNETMKEILSLHGVALKEIPRMESEGRAVSASMVRKALREDNFEVLRSLLPRHTLEFLKSPEAQPIISSLKRSMARH